MGSKVRVARVMNRETMFKMVVPDFDKEMKILRNYERSLSDWETDSWGGFK